MYNNMVKYAHSSVDIGITYIGLYVQNCVILKCNNYNDRFSRAFRFFRIFLQITPPPPNSKTRSNGLTMWALCQLSVSNDNTKTPFLRFCLI